MNESRSYGQSSEVSWPLGPTTVYGTLVMPEGAGPFAGVVLVAGSGPTDRDWNSPLLPGANGSGRLLAEALGRAGFASLRYDKRASGPHVRETIRLLIGAISMQSHVDELAGAVRTLTEQPGIRADRIFALGNSEGTLHALNYQVGDPGIPFAGLVLTGPPGRAVGVVARSQIAAQAKGIPNGEHLLGLYDAAVARFLACQPAAPDPALPEGVRDVIASLESPYNLPFARELWTADAEAPLKEVRVPVLIIIGKKDLQIDWHTDGDPLQRAVAGWPYVNFLFPENANHVLKHEPRPREELAQGEAMQRYNAADAALDPETVAAIVPGSLLARRRWWFLSRAGWNDDERRCDSREHLAANRTGLPSRRSENRLRALPAARVFGNRLGGIMVTSPAPDLVLLNGKVTVTADTGGRPHESEAIAIRSGRVLTVGANDDLAALAGPATTVVDVEGRRVVPGLIDSHVHFVRAGLTWNDETRWERIHDLEEGLGLIRDAAQGRPLGTWIRVIGGWHPDQLAERRGPTLEELDRVAPGHPVVIQNQYEWGMLNTLAMKAVGLTTEVADATGPMSVDRDGDGRPLGIVRGMASLRWLYAQLPIPSLEEQVSSTAALSRELARFGITGVMDGGGINSGPDMYHAVREARRRDQLRTRVRLMIHASGPGVEREEYEGYLRDVRPLVGDPLLQVIGLGEIVLYAIHDSESRPPSLTREAREDLHWICSQFAAARWPVQIHACRPETVEAVLDCWEAVDREHPIGALRWGLVHAECLEPSTIERLRRLGAGALIPSLFRFEGDSMLDAWGEERMRTAPPLRAILNAGVPLGGGTDALRVAPYLPFTALRWYTDGLSVSGQRTRDDANLLSREEALRAYTAAGAWFSFEEQTRGSLEPGRLADLAVLSGDYFSVPAEELASLESELTLLGGEPVWSAPTFSGLGTHVPGGPGH